MITPENVVRHELIGLAVRVAESPDPGLRGAGGRVVDETRNMLTIETKDGKEIKAAKESSVFVFTIPTREKVRVDGKVIVARPEDRIKKKLRKW